MDVHVSQFRVFFTKTSNPHNKRVTKDRPLKPFGNKVRLTALDKNILLSPTPGFLNSVFKLI